MIRALKYGLTATFLALAMAASPALAAPASIMEEKEILPYLEKVIAWQRQGAALEVSSELPRQKVLKDTLLQHAAKVVSDSFVLATTVAETLPVAPTPAALEEKVETASREVNLRRTIRLAAADIQKMQNSLAQTRARAQRERLAGEIKLAQEHLTLLKAVADTIGAPEETQNDTLTHKIAQLAATAEGEQKKAESEAPAAATTAAAPSSGILGLATRIFDLFQSRSTVKALLNDTKGLLNTNKDRSQKIRDAVQGIMEAGKTAVTNPAQTKSGIIGPVQAPATFDQLTADLKSLSKVAVALGTMNKSLTLSQRDLMTWNDTITGHIQELFGTLTLRCLVLALAIGMALGLASLARKATRRYVIDRRRKDQLRIVRKIILSVTISIILFLGFFTDFSSLATFAGLTTAGIAFAMRDMILSLIAYFQFFSTSDVRVGDEVSIAGVSGKITHIGMLRFYMVETQKSDVGYLPTGRVVGFANSVLFQPTPFFRQTAGSDFVWNEIDIVLAPTIDHAAAYSKLDEIVRKAYAKHQDNIRKSELALQRISALKLEISEPRTYFKFTNVGVTFVIRYAVERDQTQTLHRQMMMELLTAMKKDPELRAMHIAANEPTPVAPATGDAVKTTP